MASPASTPAPSTSRLGERLQRRNLLKTRPALHALAALSHPLAPLLPEGIFVFHQGRCGSTVLSRLLDQHPKLSAFGEIFETPHKRGQLPVPAAAMLRAKRAQAFPARAIAEAKFFECQHLSLLDCSIEDFVALLHAAGYRRFIILDRKNYLRRLISNALAGSRGKKFHYTASEAVPSAKISINPSQVGIVGKRAGLLEMFDYMDAQYGKLRAVLRDRDVLNLTYEDDIAEDPMVAYGRVCDWLGIEPVRTEVNLSRTNTQKTADVLLNRDEVADALAGTRYAWMLD